MTPRSICLHGPESTGKSTIAPRLARLFGTAHERRRFLDAARAALEERGVPWRLVTRTGEAPWRSVRAAVGMQDGDGGD